MINSVSSVSFRGEQVSNQDLINSPGKYTAAPAADPAKGNAPADSFEKEGAEKKKSKAPKILAAVGALLVAAYVGLGIAVGKGKLNKVVAAEGAELKFMDKVKNFFHSIGDNANSLWSKIRGNKAAEAADDAAKGTEKAAAEATTEAATAGEAAAK